tara:strand:- start:98 stop:229 length:132 start_codon:yes stop_codon:yes gene_type:complete
MLTPAAKASMRLSQTDWHDFLWMKMLALVIVFSSEVLLNRAIP